MDIDIEIAKDITASMAGHFKGDARLAAVAFQKIVNTVSKYDDQEAKLATRDIVVKMGADFGGRIELACAAFEQILASVIIAKRRAGATRERTENETSRSRLA